MRYQYWTDFFLLILSDEWRIQIKTVPYWPETWNDKHQITSFHFQSWSNLRKWAHFLSFLSRKPSVNERVRFFVFGFQSIRNGLMKCFNIIVTLTLILLFSPNLFISLFTLIHSVYSTSLPLCCSLHCATLLYSTLLTARLCSFLSHRSL